MIGNPLLAVKSLGQSLWLDAIDRRMLDDGSLRRLISEDGISGLTSNPAIFAAAMTQQVEYSRAITELVTRLRTSEAVYESLAIEDIRRAADLFRPIYEETQGRDGFVSMEISPHLAYETELSIAEASRLWRQLDRPNVMIKVPGTLPGLPVIRSLISAGINVNVTLLFSPARYEEVANAYLSGLEDRLRSGGDVTRVASVASFFLSRIDTHVDKILDSLAQREGSKVRQLRGRTALALAVDAYMRYRNLVSSDRWRALAGYGARPQRLLWASTSTKDPAYSDTKYVESLVAPETVNTLPPETLQAFRDHGRVSLPLLAREEQARQTLEQIAQLDIDLEKVAATLETEGVRKFIEPFDGLQRWIDERLSR